MSEVKPLIISSFTAYSYMLTISWGTYCFLIHLLELFESKRNCVLTDVSQLFDLHIFFSCLHFYGVKLFFLYFLNIFTDYAITVVQFLPLHSTPSCPHPFPPTFPPYSSCPWVIIEVLWLLHFLYYSYPPPVYFLPTIYATYSLYLSPLYPTPTPLLITLHVISISVVLFLF